MKRLTSRAALRQALLPAAWLAMPLPALAQWDGFISAAARQFTVAEYDHNGRGIVREQGWLPGLEGRLAYRAGDWMLSGQAELYRHRIDYRGQTQSGAPIDSSTATTLARMSTGLAYALNHVLNTSAAIEWECWRRDIKGVGKVSGLQERTLSRRLLLGLEARYPIAYGEIAASAALVLAAPEKLRVGFSGLLDEASLETRSTTGVRLGLNWRPAAWPNAQLHGGLDWWKVGRSGDVPVSRNGRFAGTIAQPEHVVRNITLGVRYWF